jgi:nitroimidazol reductase NimA-like FMN-containing flavoprotein (pyridoxamine 5'-phosphate oxidase superfamily)
LQALRTGSPVCVTVTLVDGLVLARSAFHHSVNCRSMVVFATAVEVTDLEEKRRALEAIVEHIVPGRGADARPPSDLELRVTRVVRVPIDEASAKVRTGGPRADPEDLELSVWAGEIPLLMCAGAPVGDAAVPPAAPVPGDATAYRRPARP